MNVGKNLQAVFGTRSENLKSDMEAYLKTAGSEQEDEVAATASTAAPEAIAGAAIARDPAATEKARGYIDALGGRQNIQTVTACAVTRLRVTVRDARASTAGACGCRLNGVMPVPGPAMHVIVGPHAAEAPRLCRHTAAAVAGCWLRLVDGLSYNHDQQQDQSHQ
jgi:PTS system glucose-specific IIC component